MRLLRHGRSARSSGRTTDDQGVALLLVVGAMVMLSAVLLTTLAFTLQTATPTRRDQDAKTSVAAAQAGIDEYVSRLTANDNYWQQGDADLANAAFGSGVGQTVQGTSGSGARYKYTVLSTPAGTAADGKIRLRVTGYSSPGNGQPSVARTFIATLQVRGFLSYVYLSDIEVVDPEIINPSSPLTACAQYYYAGRSGVSGCPEIQWTGGDVVNGPLHSNDALQINGSVTFTDRATSSWPALNGTSLTKTWWGTRSGSPPLPGRAPVYGSPVSLPVGSATLLQNVAPDVDGSSTTPTGPGCYYQGATEFVFSGSSLQVRSPMTARSDTPSRCLDVTTRSSWQTVSPIPPVIYVDTATSGSCTTGSTSAFGYPKAGEEWNSASATAVSWSTDYGTRIPNYSCMRGSAYVQGTVTGSVTIASADDVVITGDLQPTSLTGSDVIGIIGGNCVWIYHPINGGGSNLGGFTPATRISAAVLALRHSILVANWQRGNPLGTLNVTGALAQKFRGPVGTGSSTSVSTGYLKNYVYDARLANVQPPYFLKPTSSPWRLTSLVDG